MLDRYDQYAGKFTEVIHKLGNTCIVLVDCKGLTQLSDVNMCDISFNKSRIEVSAGVIV